MNCRLMWLARSTKLGLSCHFLRGGAECHEITPSNNIEQMVVFSSVVCNCTLRNPQVFKDVLKMKTGECLVFSIGSVQQLITSLCAED